MGLYALDFVVEDGREKGACWICPASFIPNMLREKLRKSSFPFLYCDGYRWSQMV